MKLQSWILISLFIIFIACGGGKKTKKSEQTTNTENPKEYQHIIVGSNGQLLSVPRYPKHESDYHIIMVGPDKNVEAVPATDCPHCLKPQSPYISIIR